MVEQIAWIELCGVTLGGDAEPDRGLVWEDLTGWWGLPDIRGNRDSIPGGHGSFQRTRALRESRVMALQGYITTSDRASFIEARNRLTAALADGIGLMRVGTDEGTWERQVEIDSFEVKPDHGQTFAEFTVDLVATDPRRYGPWQTVGPIGLPTHTGGLMLPSTLPWDLGTSTGEGSQLLVENTGALPLSPRLRVTGGGMSSVTVQDMTTGDRLILTVPVQAGAEVVLDAAARRVWVDGQDATRWLVSRQWPVIDPAQTHEFRFEVAGATGPQLWADYRIGAW